VLENRSFLFGKKTEEPAHSQQGNKDQTPYVFKGIVSPDIVSYFRV
jgi:hypothetical protein